MPRKKMFYSIYVFSIMFAASVLSIRCPVNSNEKDTIQQMPQKALNDKELMGKYRDLCTELELTTVIEGIEGYSQEGILYKKEYSDIFDCWTAEITGAVDMKLDLQTGHLLKIFNSLILNKIYGDNSLKDPYEGKPKMDKEQVVEKVEKYIRIIEGEQKYKTKLIEVIFSKQGNLRGNWILRWKRYHDKYMYYEDRIELDLNETYGIVTYANHCISDIPSTVEVKIFEEEAHEKAIEFANNLISSKKIFSGAGVSFKKWFRDFIIGSVISSELLIVNPNYLLTDKSTYMASNRIRKANLAWAVTVEAKYIGKTGPKGETLGNKKILVWIDAATGEILGGDFTL